MSRRASLPGAAELFRTTGGGADAPELRANSGDVASAEPLVAAVSDPEPDLDAAPRLVSSSRGVRSTRRVVSAAARAPTGRERHEEKITVYCSPEELLDLERARLTLRAEHGMAVDRGRMVREAIAVVLADLDAKGESSILVRRLRDS